MTQQLGDVGGAGVLNGKVAIVTGGGGGIGRGIVMALLKEGAAVAVVDVNSDAANAVARDGDALGGQTLALAVDVRDAKAVRTCVQQVIEAFGSVNILVNNAQAGPHDIPLEEHTDADFQLALESGPLATWYYMSACFEHLKNGGRIINFRSASEYQGFAGHGAYIAAKGAIQAMSKNAAREWGKHGITVNCISPFVLHPAALKHYEQFPEQKQLILDKLSIPRSGDAEFDVGRSVVFLAGPDASFITGCTLGVDGGGTFL